LRKYHLLEDVKDKSIVPMFPPGRLLFLRPLKSRGVRRKASGKRVSLKSWDAVWITAQELIGEGILVSKAMLEDHLIQSSVCEAIAASIIWHPANPCAPAELEAQRALAMRLDKLADIVVEARPEGDRFASLEAGTRI